MLLFFRLSGRGDGVGGPRPLPRTVNGVPRTVNGTGHRVGVSGRARDPRRLGGRGDGVGAWGNSV